MAKRSVGAIALALPLLLASGATLNCGGKSSVVARPKLTPKDIVTRSKPAIVRVESMGGDRVGTGFIVAANGIIATNLHVVAGANDIRVKLLDGTVYPVARIIGVDSKRDLVLLSIDARAPLPILLLGDSNAVSAGDPVVAIGNPLGVFDYTVSDGLISSVRVESPELTVLQISAPISPGSSGGPLFNPFGEVIGIATAIIMGGQDINFGIPTNYLQPLLASKSAPISIAQFAEATTPPHDDNDDPRVDEAHGIARHVPHHEIKLLDGCTQSDLEDVARAIDQAIQSGAPLYNQGNREACFRIYEGTAIKYEREAACAGVRSAFGDGLLRANALTDATAKAWALRDTFDGILDVMIRKVNQLP